MHNVVIKKKRWEPHIFLEGLHYHVSTNLEANIGKRNKRSHFMFTTVMKKSYRNKTKHENCDMQV